MATANRYRALVERGANPDNKYTRREQEFLVKYSPEGIAARTRAIGTDAPTGPGYNRIGGGGGLGLLEKRRETLDWASRGGRTLTDQEVAVKQRDLVLQASQGVLDSIQAAKARGETLSENSMAMLRDASIASGGGPAAIISDWNSPKRAPLGPGVSGSQSQQTPAAPDISSIVNDTLTGKGARGAVASAPSVLLTERVENPVGPGGIAIPSAVSLPSSMAADFREASAKTASSAAPASPATAASAEARKMPSFSATAATAGSNLRTPSVKDFPPITPDFEAALLDMVKQNKNSRDSYYRASGEAVPTPFLPPAPGPLGGSTASIGATAGFGRGSGDPYGLDAHLDQFEA